MTDAVLVAIITSAAVVLASLITFAGIVINRKLDHITVLTNSTLTTANDRIKTLEDRISAMKPGSDAATAAIDATQKEQK